MWMYELGNEKDIVISTRVRIARNLKNIKFPFVMDNNEVNFVKEKVKKVIESNNEYKYFELSDIDELTKLSLVEKHIISKDLIKNDNKSALIMSDDLSTSIMINEEDHIRIQKMCSGLDIEKCSKEAYEIDKMFESSLEYAYSDKYGYLTTCPTNVGAAMRISVMLHLPALTEINYIDKLIQEANRLGISIRGMYGENTQSLGDIYQISNQNILGISEKDVIYKIKQIINNIIDKERKYRKLLLEQNTKLEDDIYRSYGILKYARSITASEAYTLISNVKLGVNLNIIKDVTLETLNKISVDINPYTLQLINKKYMEEDERDRVRAKYIREVI